MKITKSIAQLGSNWNNGSNAGAFNWNLNNSVRNRNRNISSQLVNAQNKGVLKCDTLVLYKSLNCLTLPLGRT